jgi:paraquat-inducible protein B
VYGVSFTGADGGAIRPGTEVQLQGTEVGEVTEAHLDYDDARQSLATRVTLEIDPSRIQIVHARHETNADPLGALATRIAHLVAQGLRAHLTTANFLTSAKVVSLDLDKDSAPARIVTVDGIAMLPSAPSTDISQVLATLQSTLHHLDAATAGPELKHSIQELDRTLTHLDQITAGVEPEVQPLLASLRQTSEAAQHTLAAADGIVGNSAASGADLTRLVRELTDAARSIRDLTDYLDRHPEALIRGRRGDAQ